MTTAVAVSTGTLSPDTAEALGRAADLGFTHVEVNLQSDELNYGYRRKPQARLYRQLHEQCQALGLEVWSVSAAPLRPEEMFSARARREMLLASTAAAGILGARVFVVEPADIFASDEAFQAFVRDGGAPPVIDGYDEAWAQAVNRRLTMALVNRDYWLGAPLTNHAERLGGLLEDLAIGCAFDLPAARRRAPLDEWQRCLGGRLALAYAYDVAEDGRPAAPREPAWAGYLAELRPARLNCLVIRAGRDDSDDDLARSRLMLHDLHP